MLLVGVLVGSPAWGQVPPTGAMSAPDAWVPRPVADLIMLEKLRAQPSALRVPTGQSGIFGTLTVTVKQCVTRPSDLPQNSAAFLEVVDSKGSAPVFRGWVLSNTPAVSQFEHPLYDIRLVACRA